jgi:hypothetical protein
MYASRRIQDLPHVACVPFLADIVDVIETAIQIIGAVDVGRSECAGGEDWAVWCGICFICSSSLFRGSRF